VGHKTLVNLIVCSYTSHWLSMLSAALPRAEYDSLSEQLKFSFFDHLLKMFSVYIFFASLVHVSFCLSS